LTSRMPRRIVETFRSDGVAAPRADGDQRIGLLTAPFFAAHGCSSARAHRPQHVIRGTPSWPVRFRKTTTSLRKFLVEAAHDVPILSPAPCKPVEFEMSCWFHISYLWISLVEIAGDFEAKPSMQAFCAGCQQFHLPSRGRAGFARRCHSRAGSLLRSATTGLMRGAGVGGFRRCSNTMTPDCDSAMRSIAPMIGTSDRRRDVEKVHHRKRLVHAYQGFLSAWICLDQRQVSFTGAGVAIGNQRNAPYTVWIRRSAARSTSFSV